MVDAPHEPVASPRLAAMAVGSVDARAVADGDSARRQERIREDALAGQQSRTSDKTMCPSAVRALCTSGPQTA